MKKTIIASAIAATVLSTSAHSMETASELAAMLESMPTVYGNIQLAWSHTDVEGDGGTGGLADNGSTIGFKHSHQVNDDLKAFIKIELEFDADNKATNDNLGAGSKNGGLNSFDEAYIGLEGSFGRVWLGSDDSVLEQNTVKTANHFEFISTSTFSGLATTGEGDLLQYTSPSMEGFKVFGAVQLDKSETENPFQIGVSYSADALTVALGMDSNDGASGYSDKTGVSDPSDENSYSFRVGYTMDNLSLSGEFHTRDDVADIASVLGVYSMGATQFALSLSQEDKENNDETTIVGLQALYTLSGNTYVYAEAAFKTAEVSGVDTDTETVAVGAVYYF